MTKPTMWLCAQRRLRSAWACTQSDQSLRCPHEETSGPQLPIKRKRKTQIRLGGCPGWSEFSLGAHSFYWFCHVVAHFMTNPESRMTEPVIVRILRGRASGRADAGYKAHLPITRMRNPDQYKKSIRGVSGLALEESKMHTFSRLWWIIFPEKYLCKL